MKNRIRYAVMLICTVVITIVCFVYADAADTLELKEVHEAISEDLTGKYTVTYTYNGEIIKTVCAEKESMPDVFIPEKEGMRFAGWKDEEGNSAVPEKVQVTADIVYEAEFFPLFGTDEPYLFANDIKLMLPESDLTFSDFSKAMQALIPENSTFPKAYFHSGDSSISGNSIKSFLAAFYSQEELQIVPMTTSVSRGEFAHIINTLTGRNDEKIIPDEYARITADIIADFTYRKDVLEACIPHSRTQNGISWDMAELETDWREYEPFSEMIYKEPTEHGTVYTSYGKNMETYMYYLPYGYDESKQYNVLLYLSGGDGDPNWILGAGQSYAEYNKIFDRKVNTLDFIDSLIQYGYCDPLIVCTTYTTMGTVRVERYIEMLQYTVDNYSTYAESSDIQDITAARKHFAIAGPSNASQSICVTIQNLPDIFAYYGMFSGMYEFYDTIEAFSKLDTIEYLVMNAGEYDNNRSTTERAYGLMSVMDNVKDSDFVLAEKLGHCRAAFDEGLMTLLFRFSPNTRDIR